MTLHLCRNSPTFEGHFLSMGSVVQEWWLRPQPSFLSPCLPGPGFLFASPGSPQPLDGGCGQWRERAQLVPAEMALRTTQGLGHRRLMSSLLVTPGQCFILGGGCGAPGQTGQEGTISLLCLGGRGAGRGRGRREGLFLVPQGLSLCHLFGVLSERVCGVLCVNGHSQSSLGQSL